MRLDRFNVDVWYSEKYYPSKRHKKPRTRMLKEIVSVFVPEPSPDDFPVALIENQYGWWHDSVEPEFKLISTEIRLHDHKLWKPLRMSDCVKGGIGWAPADHLYHILDRHARSIMPFCGTPDVPFDDDKSIVISSDFANRISDLRGFSEFYRVFDDKIWMTTNEPKYAIITFGLGNNHGGTSMFIEHHINPNIGEDNYFSALHYSDAVEYGKKVAAERGDTKSISSIGERCFIDVLMPEVIRYTK